MLEEFGRFRCGSDRLSWIKQACHATCFGIDRSDVSAFVPVARDASQSKVFQCGRAAVLATDDVVHLMGKARVLFTYETVLTLAVGPVGNLATRFLRDISGHWRESGGPWLWPFAECALAP